MHTDIGSSVISRWQRSIGLALCLGLAFLLVAVFLAGMRSAMPAMASPANLYIDGAGGSDTPTCGAPSAPCKTISYTLNTRAASGDSLQIASGTYTENLTIHLSLTLQGGFDPSTWERTGWTTIDGSKNGQIYGDWDGDRVRYPHVIKDGSTYKMWYTGVDINSKYRIGYATSPDGIIWTRHLTPVLDLGAPGEWDEYHLMAPFVLKDGPSSYKMWYTGHGMAGWSIGYATSSDGLSWTKYINNPVLTKENDPWNNETVTDPFIIQASGSYTMYLTATGNDGGGNSVQMAYATSPDGINWTFGPNNPLFGRTWESWIWRPFVLKEGSLYKMWHSAWSNGGHTTYVTSTNGVDWSKYGSPVLSGASGQWDESGALEPSVLAESGGYTLWYDNYDAIGRATSPDGISWTRPLTTPVFTGGTLTYGQPVIRIENPAAHVILDGRFTITGGAGEIAGGIEAGEATVTIRNCRIERNTANGAPNSWGGGGVISNGLLRIEDSWIQYNQVAQGAGGVRVGNGTLVMTNTIVAANGGDFGIHLNGSASLMNITMSDNEFGLLFNSPAPHALRVTNSILYNMGSVLETPDTGIVTVTYSDIQGGWPGEGNIDLDPRWKGYMRLFLDSPCIDAGTNFGAPDHDLDGNHRPWDGNLDRIATTDMGAYEMIVFWTDYLPLIRK